MRPLICILVALALTGCGVELLTTTAIQGELQAQQLKAVEGQVGRTADTSAKINIQRAIDTYQAEKGSYPASLEELVPAYLPSLPAQPDGTPYAYDAATGKLMGGPPRNAILPGPTAGDRQKMKQILDAIDKYGRAVGYYPPSLNALVPAYISAIPKTDSGEEFVFKPETGELRHPTQPAKPVPAAAAAGAGPMGEAMTGIGMQNQLNSMSNAGASGVAGHARNRAAGAVQQQQQQQEQALQDLGY